MNAAYTTMDVIFNSFWSWLGFFGPVTLWILIWAFVSTERAKAEAKRPKVWPPDN